MSDVQINNQFENYERNHETASQRYQELIQARGERGGPKFEASKNAIKRAAQEKRYLSYGELAEASSLEWSKAYRLIGRHLGGLVTWGHAHGFPMLSAIVVNKENVETGEVNEEALRGFKRAAEALGKDFDDARTLLKEEQKHLFDKFSARTSDNDA